MRAMPTTRSYIVRDARNGGLIQREARAYVAKHVDPTRIAAGWQKVPTTFRPGLGALRLRLYIPAKPATTAPITAPNTYSENATVVGGMYGDILVKGGGRQLNSFSRQPSVEPSPRNPPSTHSFGM
jgi:hypothetical protein